jgi:putative Ca2+/H+ antiporter (TMEM165/GDT1 family)
VSGAGVGVMIANVPAVSRGTTFAHRVSPTFLR